MTALLRAGFHIHHQGHGLVLLKHGTKMVLVPSVESMSPEMFDAIARSAGLTRAELEDHLPRARRDSGTFARPRLDASDIAPPSSAGGGRRRRR